MRRLLLTGALLATAGLTACSSRGPVVQRDNYALTKFDRIKALEGTWKSDDTDGDGVPETASYRVVSGGSAVVETLFVGTPHEMVTVYHVDGNDLVVSHFCALANQSLMRSVKTDAGNALRFKFEEGMNLDERQDKYMGELQVTFRGEDRFDQEWTAFRGREADNSVKFVWRRASGYTAVDGQ